ncbi:SGNH/GDSL hydrolase family protein [Streptomyces aureoverticillatus]|uniref:SGNH/GDSL hydrolase family protein n=1 Tax=Streptomyces aureoverticillatus TaxID=66871 RepID=UPI0013DCA6DB|nr:SGNH/GDSL hydrolase family protein [Streptomyces aureoverticillatus]QIB44597.1 SGNH/GDSL hydrolase family protein [Streptomyces aureoverticillatus]
MRRTWCVGLLLGAVLLGGCGDPGSGDEAAPPPPAPGDTPSQTTRQRAEADRRERDAAPDRDAPGRKHDDPAPKAPAGKPRPDVLYLGDSLAMENQDVLGTLLRDQLGARYTSAPYSGTTLCDYLEGTGEDSLVPDKDKAATLVRELRPDYVVLQFWGNAWGYTPCMKGITYDKARQRYLARYEADARRLTDQITEAARDAGVRRPKVVWVSQGPDAITPDRVRHVNGIYRQQATATGDLVSDAGKAVSPASARYTWAEKLPCTAWERAHPEYCTDRADGRTSLHRAKDDYLHFCLAPTTPKSRPCPVRSPGIRRIGQAVTDTLRDHST